MELNEITKARDDVATALERLAELTYGAGVNRVWLAIMDRLDAQTDQRLIAFGISDQANLLDLSGLTDIAFPIVRRFVDSLK